MGIATTLAIASLVVAAGSAYMQNKNAAAARKQQKKAAEIAQAQNQVQQQNDIRNQIRQQRIRTAQILQASADTGTSGSSGQIGGVAALATQVGSNIGTMSGRFNSQNAILSYQNAAAADEGQAATWGAVGQLASSSFNVFSNTPGFKTTMANIFS